jgi:hypothetical protein
MSFKDKVEAFQAVLASIAIIVGGWWTLNNFILERRAYPHAEITQKISHLKITDDVNLLRVVVDIKNTGTSKLELGSMIARVERVLPIFGCPLQQRCIDDDLNQALNSPQRADNHFPWPLVAERDDATHRLIEPGEEDMVDIEFAVPAAADTIRVYTYFNNPKISSRANEMGWWTADFYSFRPPQDGNLGHGQKPERADPAPK